jgi:hypothetical protein
MTTLSCRHREEAVGAGVHRCGSPKLVGLKLVTEATCRACHYRDHDPAPPADRPAHLLPCLRLGPELPRGCDGPARFECRHLDHPVTTERQCRDCRDYLFPLYTPETPPGAVVEMLALPPQPQAQGWWGWANVHEGFRRAADEVIAGAPPYPEELAGRGVVIVGGGSYFASAYVTIRVLRHVGCRLPVQLWHLDGEMNDAMRAALAPHGVTCVDADELARRRPFRFLHGHWWKGWQLKPYAIVHSPFREVLLLDADCYPTRDPGLMFDWPPYRERGATFWPDLASSAWMLRPETWRIFGAQPGWLALESGQLLIDKRACWRELQLALWYNSRADFVYNILWGDKDTFNVAWRRLGTHYSMTQHRCDWDTHTILQYGPDGAVLFQHRCQDKFRLGPARFASTYQTSAANRHNPRLAHEDFCFAVLDELRGMRLPGVEGAEEESDE